MKNNPIGVFDSGIGGLTVVKELIRLLPNEDIVYFGDTARLPYGTKSVKVVQSFARDNTRFLLKQNVKLVVVACNTVSAVALTPLQEEHELPIIGVIRPGAQAAVESTRNKKVGVVGTPRTITSGAYTSEINKADKGIKVSAQACPLFVPLAEEGWESKEATRAVAEEYLAGLKKEGIDTLVLGCTHYPILKGVIGRVMGTSVALVDSATATAKTVRALMKEKDLLTDEDNPGHLQVFISDIPYQFKATGERFLGRELKGITRVDLEAIDLGGYE